MAKTLLLADDSVTIQKVVGISFASEDVTLITVDNGDDAIAKAQESRPDAILADVVMPGKSGYATVQYERGGGSLQGGCSPECPFLKKLGIQTPIGKLS